MVQLILFYLQRPFFQWVPVRLCRNVGLLYHVPAKLWSILEPVCETSFGLRRNRLEGVNIPTPHRRLVPNVFAWHVHLWSPEKFFCYATGKTPIPVDFWRQTSKHVASIRWNSDRWSRTDTERVRSRRTTCSEGRWTRPWNYFVAISCYRDSFCTACTGNRRTPCTPPS